MSTKTGWQAVHGKDIEALPPEAQQRIRDAMARTPIAEVTVSLYGLGRGESAVGWRVAPGGPLSAASEPKATAAAKTQAVGQLLDAIKAELDRNFKPLAGRK